MRPYVTKHALERFNERIRPDSNVGDVLASFARSVRDDSLLNLFSFYPAKGKFVRVDVVSGVVFLCKAGGVKVDRPRIITVVRYDMGEIICRLSTAPAVRVGNL